MLDNTFLSFYVCQSPIVRSWAPREDRWIAMDEHQFCNLVLVFLYAVPTPLLGVCDELSFKKKILIYPISILQLPFWMPFNDEMHSCWFSASADAAGNSLIRWQCSFINAQRLRSNSTFKLNKVMDNQTRSILFVIKNLQLCSLLSRYRDKYVIIIITIC